MRLYQLTHRPSCFTPAGASGSSIDDSSLSSGDTSDIDGSSDMMSGDVSDDYPSYDYDDEESEDDEDAGVQLGSPGGSGGAAGGRRRGTRRGGERCGAGVCTSASPCMRLSCWWRAWLPPPHGTRPGTRCSFYRVPPAFLLAGASQSPLVSMGSYDSPPPEEPEWQRLLQQRLSEQPEGSDYVAGDDDDDDGDEDEDDE